ncbi:hypothetical protein [Pantoea sp. A4]|uniref:hypothetical protein n=1 Tax=Pantoea sp. A4 TaxID=1225184 RepID=UPI0012EE3E03|nr:hypothetical protein [Pantoea sp. A4]
MKNFIFGLALVIFLPNTSSAEQESMDMLNQLHEGVCKDHRNPDLCKRVVGIIMKGVKQNDDIYIECMKNKPATPEDAMYCQSAKDVRSKIDTYN